MPGPTFRKAGANVPLGYFAWEAAGLRWLAAVQGGAAVVSVVEAGEHGGAFRRGPTQASEVVLGVSHNHVDNQGWKQA